MKASYKIYRKEDGKVKAIRESSRKREIESMFNGIMRNHRRFGVDVVEIREGYTQLPYFGIEYWIAKE